MNVTALFDLLTKVVTALPPDVTSHDNYLGVRVDESGATATLGFRGEVPVELAISAQRAIESKTRLKYGGGEHATLLLDLIPTMKPQSDSLVGESVNAGDSCNVKRCHDGPTLGSGTMGWFFFLDDELVCVTNRHVAVPSGSPDACLFTPDGRKVGSYYWSDVSPTRQVFDLALVMVVSSVRCSGKFRMGGPARRPYPKELWTDSTIDADASFYLVGATTADGTTHFRGVGCRKSAFDKSERMYYDQLFFDRCSSGGDSGAVIVHEESNTVIGLASMVDSNFTIASPLFLQPWKYREMVERAGVQFPRLSAKA